MSGAHQITKTGQDSMPSFSADGNWIYFIETRQENARFSLRGKPERTYVLTYPLLERIHLDGSGRDDSLELRPELVRELMEQRTHIGGVDLQDRRTREFPERREQPDLHGSITAIASEICRANAGV